MLDRLPPVWRHLLIALVPALLAWAATDLIPSLPPGAAAVLAPLVSVLVLIVTPLTRQYGAGAPDDPEPPA
jgi:hypothetical protein